MKTKSPLFLSIGKTAKRLGVSIPTLRLWDAAGSFVPELRTEGGQRRYSVEQVLAKAGEVKSAPTIGYCRVSSAELIFAMCANKGIPVLILNQNPDASFEEDLAKDVLDIVTVFSARLYGSRSKRNKTLLENLQKAAKREK